MGAPAPPCWWHIGPILVSTCRKPLAVGPLPLPWKQPRAAQEAILPSTSRAQVLAGGVRRPLVTCGLGGSGAVVIQSTHNTTQHNTTQGRGWVGVGGVGVGWGWRGLHPPPSGVGKFGTATGFGGVTINQALASMLLSLRPSSVSVVAHLMSL